MFWILILIPFATVVTAFLLYRQVGKRDFFKLDIVQFVYAFVLSPLSFVWLKSFLLYFAKNETTHVLSQNQLFLLDTAFSVIFLYLYAFVVMHSLTKTFEVKLQRDPLFDILEHSEQLHLRISHTSMYMLIGLIFTLLAITNMFFPIQSNLTQIGMYTLFGIGVAAGFVAYAGIWLSNFTKGNFLRIIKLIYGVYFMVLIVAYFVFDLRFSGDYGLYWFVFSMLSGMVLASQLFQRSERSRKLVNRFHHKHKEGWSEDNFLTILEKLRPEGK